MGKPISVDLRDRVVAAVRGGMSRRQAAARFGVSISSAIRWTSLLRRMGDVRPKRQGGDKRWERIEAYAPVILGAVAEKPDNTLVALQTLVAEHGSGWRSRLCGASSPAGRSRSKKSAHAAEQDHPDARLTASHP